VFCHNERERIAEPVNDFETYSCLI
jgi:hypothetical protein